MTQRLNKIQINTTTGLTYGFLPLGHNSMESWLGSQQHPTHYIIHNPEVNKGICVPKQTVTSIEYEYGEEDEV